MSKYGSLYDAYKLENSRAIPLYQGSTAPEALQVAQYNQGLYDTAQAGAFSINNGLQGVTSLPQDKAAVDELRSSVQGKLSQFAKAKDYENMVPQVQQLGVEFSNRFRELQAPIQQRAEYQKELENKDYNLTAEQKNGLLAMSDAEYTGLKKDEYGRLTGKYLGTAYDKNIDLNKWVDDRIKDITVQKGGSEIANDNGIWKIKKGNEWEKLDGDTIETVLRTSMANSADYLGYRSMMGNIAGFKSRHIPLSAIPDTVVAKDSQGKAIEVPNPIKGQIKDAITKYGLSEKEAISYITKHTTEQDIESNAINYARTKYQVNNLKTNSESGIGEFQIKDYEHKLKEQGTGLGIFGDLVTGQGIDLSQKYGNAGELETKINSTAASVATSEDYINGQKNRVARASGIKPSGKNGQYTKDDLSKVTDQQVGTWFSQNDPQELGRYQSNLGIINGSRDQILEMNQVRDAAMDAAVKKATGGQRTYSQLKTNATEKFRKGIEDGSLNDLVDNSQHIGNSMGGGGSHFLSAGITKENAKDWEVVDGTNHSIFNSQLTLRNVKTGRTMNVHQANGNAKPMQEATDIFKGVDWKSSYKEGVQGLRSNMAWMPLLNKTTPDGETTKAGAYAMRAEGLLSTAAGSGAVRLTDNNDVALSKYDESNYKSLMAAGQYKLLGIGTDPKTGQRRAMVTITVDKDASDPKDRYKTLMVGADSNFWDRMASSVQQTAGRDLNSNDPSLRAAAIKDLQFGMGMATGSGYSDVGSMMAGHSRTIKNQNGQAEMKVVAAPTGDGSNAVMYYLYKTKPDGSLTTEPPVPFNSSLDLGAYLDMQKRDGKVITK